MNFKVIMIFCFDFSSENQRIECVEKCGQLSQDCFKQEVCQEALRERLKDIESKMEQYKLVI